TDALNHSSTFAYDAASRLTGSTDRNGRRDAYVYDNANRLTTLTWYNSGGTAVNTFTYGYDPNSNELTAANAAGAYTFSYDRLNRVSAAQEPFGVVLTNS